MAYLITYHYQQPAVVGACAPVCATVKSPQVVSAVWLFARVAFNVYALVLGPAEKLMLYLIASPAAPLGDILEGRSSAVAPEY